MDDTISLEMTIDDISVGSKSNTYVPITLGTNRGEVHCRYYHTPGEKRAVIFVGGVGGGFDSPARNLYTKLSHALTLHKISSLRLAYRHPDDLLESALDVLAGITFLERFGIDSIALVGHSFGSAVVIQAAAAAPETITTVVTLAAQAYGAEVVRDLRDTPLLLIHGTADEILSSTSSTYIHDIADTEKELLLIDGARHNLDEASKEVYGAVQDWLIEHV